MAQHNKPLNINGLPHRGENSWGEQPYGQIDQDIRCSNTLEARFYQSHQAHQHLLDSVFAGSWQFLMHRDDLQDHDVFPLTLLPGSLEEPLLLSLSKDHGSSGSHWTCLSNVCTHRGHLLVEKAGKGTQLRCRYHGRTFDLAGQLKKAPGFEGALNFPCAEDHLPRLPLEQLGGLFFTRLHQRPGYSVHFTSISQVIRDRLSDNFLEALRPKVELDQDYRVDAHWALYCDNYLEGFHIPYVHPALNRSLDYGAYQTILFDGGSLQIGIAKEGELCFEQDQRSGDQQGLVAAYYYFFFPNLMLNFYPWGLSSNVVEPVGIDQCRVRFRTFVARPDLLKDAYDIDEVQREDEEVVHSVQRGLQSRLYRRGRFSPEQERGVHHFHRQIAAAFSPT